jgi:O-acetylhomoserine (thiol)-lyase
MPTSATRRSFVRRCARKPYAEAMTDRQFGFDTRALHAGQRPDPYTGARAVPIFQTTSYVFEDVASAAAYFDLQEYGNTYSRIMNPTVAVLEERIASLEGGAGAVAFASGLAAQAATFFTLLQPGDHVVASRALYGGSITQLKHLFRKLSVDLDLVDPHDLDAWRRAAGPRTRLLYGETIGNPAGTVLDLEAVAGIAHGIGVPLVVDNTFATPYLCRPIEWGADIVVHSVTKFLGGHGTSIGGIVVDSGGFDWSNGHFPGVADPSPAYHDLAFHETFGMYGFLMKLRAETLRDLGAALSPFNAFLFLQGVETLGLRMDRHVANALGVAAFLEGRAEVVAVRHPAREPLAARYLPRGAGAVFSFDLRGGRDAGVRLIEALDLWSHLANVGDAKSLVIHPASTTHRQLSDDELAGAGIGPGTIRLSVGLEDLEDLVWDLDRGLQAAGV